MEEGFIKDTFELVIKEIQTVVTISYIIIVAIGMLFTYQKYSEFGINIFDFADVFEFLIAPFSDFKILLFSAITIISAFLLFKVDGFYQRKFPKTYSKVNLGWDKKSWFNWYRYVLFSFLMIMYLYVSADYYGEFMKEQIEEKSPIVLKYSDDASITGKLIGNTKEVLFILQGEKVKAIPMESVKEFEINRPDN